MKRPAGYATYEEHPKGSGKWRVRQRIEGKLKTLASGLTEVGANEMADAVGKLRHIEAAREGVTLEQFAEGFLARRKDKGVRGWKKDGLRFRKHVSRVPIGKLAVTTLTRRDVIEWRDALKGEHRSRVRNLNLLRACFEDALERELIESNPAREVKVHRSGAARTTDDLEGILSPAEQRALIDAVPLRDRPAVVFALFTGLRLSEQWRLDWIDLTDLAVIVSKSVDGEGPKSGKVREVPLLPEAVQAVTVQRAFGRKGPIVFPGARGARRQDTKSPLTWPKWVKAAGIKRHITWHDLRHTCATALLAGWWGRKWSLDEVCKMLGHSSIAVTERYARKLNETLRLAVAATSGPAFLMFPSGNNGGAMLLNPKGKAPVKRAFVKHRSQVQVQQSAPALTSARGEHGGNTEGNDDADDFAASFGAAISDHLARVEPSARITAPSIEADEEAADAC